MKYPLFLFIAAVHALSSFSQPSAILGGYLPNFNGDHIKCVLGANSIIGQIQSLDIKVVGKRFLQKIDINIATYIYVSDGENYIHGLIEPGDSVIMKLDTTNSSNPLSFQGRGKEKFEFRNMFLSEKIYKKITTQLAVIRTKNHPFDFLFHYLDSAENKMIQQLDSIKLFISEESYSLLLGDVKASFMTNRNYCITTIHSETAETTLKTRQKELTPASKKRLKELQSFENKYNYSTSYINGIYTILFTDYDSRVLQKEISMDLPAKYNYLGSKLPVGLRVPVLTLFLENDIGKLNSGDDLEEMINKTFSKVKDSAYKNYIVQKYALARDTADFRRGIKAPDFIVENVKGEKVNLSSFNGKVVYIDFWYEACGPCHTLFSTLEATREHFRSDTNVVFLYVSIDRREVWKKSLLQHPMEVYHVFTENKESNHPMIKAYKVQGYPTTCLIDKKGNIFNANPARMPDKLQEQIDSALKLE